MQTTRCYLYLFLAISFISIGASANDLITTQMPSFVLKDNLQGVDGLDNPRDITLSKDKKWAFVVSADDNSLSVFKVNPDFSLSHRQTIKSSDKIKVKSILTH